ncbi:EcoKI restriction-modification system protein HsdS [Streptococcus mitis]|uniref:EcoKI restriction-modification system protein HsdS n=1 Tax=Streptococcus mitis TaxID=28037 RepID=A0A3R9LD24_STRMT|nr:restriction endonuclease subunit S [Streptococcus mitis]RSK02089.1 EcoKI restriction-modification system protein HsdS [Streptococcus mitis]
MKNESPKYRFDKFNQNWIIVKVSDIAGQYKTGGTPSTKKPIFWEGTIPWIQSSDIQKDTLFGVIPQKFISEEGLRNSSAKLILKNSIAIVTRVGVGKLAIIDQDYATSQDFLSLSDLKEDTNFLVYSIYRMLQKESTQQQGTSIKGITKEDLLCKKISLPKIEEQSAIGSLFCNLDELLSSYKDNLANYQSLKATMLSKMFPKAGKTVPEIRLDGFEDEWEKGTIGEFGSFYYGKSAPKWSVTDEATTPCVRYGELYTKFSTKIDKIYSYTSIPKENLKLSSGNEVLVPRVGENPLDFANCSWLSLKDVAIGEMISVYNTPNNPLFIAYYFNAKMRKEFAKRVEGGSVANLYYTYLENISISVPSLPEQQAIGTYFSNLDNLINSHQEKISQLETLKKKLLQDMFI